MALTPEQKATLHECAEKFQAYNETPGGIEDNNMHRSHERFFKERLSEGRLASMGEGEFREAYKKLWASQMWTKKDWYIDNRLLGPNGMDRIRAGLQDLLYGSGGMEERYDRFRAAVKWFGPASISEILHFVYPADYCIWNDKPKTVMPALGLDILPGRLFRSQIGSGGDYMQCVRALGALRDELAGRGIGDFIDLDRLFWFVFRKAMPDRPPDEPSRRRGRPPKIRAVPPAPPRQDALLRPGREEAAGGGAPRIATHQSAQYHLLRLGNLMGFATYTADGSREHDGRRLSGEATLSEMPEFAGQRDIVAAKNVDVIWFDENENPAACFEVEHTTGISPGLHRLSQIMHYRARFFIVASESQRDKFAAKMRGSPYRSMTDSFGFISYDELSGLLESAGRFYGQKDRLLWKG